MNVIDYRDIYDKLKDKPAKELNRELEVFWKIAEWKQNDRRYQANEDHNTAHRAARETGTSLKGSSKQIDHTDS